MKTINRSGVISPTRQEQEAPRRVGTKRSAASKQVDSVNEAVPGSLPLRGHGLVSLVREQVPTTAVRPLTTRLELTLKEAATLLAVTERTLARRLEEPNGKLDTNESERLLLLHNLALHGQAVFEDQGKFNRWLRRPLPLLDGRSPLGYLDTATSFQVVDQLLGRLEHGVYS